MVITLYTQELLNDLRSKSHYEVSQIENVEVRYRAEAGSEKTDEIKRCISDGIARLRHRCWRFLREEITETNDNGTYWTDESVFDLSLSELRAINKSEPLTVAMHTFVVEYALSKFYSDMSMQDLSNKHSVLAMEAGDRIDDMLFTKMPPRV